MNAMNNDRLILLAIILFARILFGGLDSASSQDKKSERKPRQEVAKEKPDPTKFEMHEWGVFTAPRDATWLKQDMVAEWSSFPDFFHGVWPKQKLSYRGPVTKPVIYFHTDQVLNIRLEVRFAKGRPLVWWPPAEHPNVGAPWVQSLTGKKFDKDTFVQFQLRTNDGLERQRKVPKGHWLEALRKVKSASVMSYGSHNQFREHYQGREQESFVYYDGLMPAPKPPQLERSKTGVIIKTDSRHDWHDIFLIERSENGVRVASKAIDRIERGNNEFTIQWKNLGKGGLDDQKARFRKICIANGLNEDEADSILSVWGKGLFDRSGITLLYRISQATYDEWIPIATKPKAFKTKRVGWIVHHHLEPELQQNVKRMISDLGSTDYQKRKLADDGLREIGGPAMEQIRQAMDTASPEVRLRCKKILRIEELEKKVGELMKKYRE